MIIYTGTSIPQKLAGEARMFKDPIRVTPVSPEHNLDPLSRANCSKVFLVNHNVKVKEVGKVDTFDFRKLKAYYVSEIKKDLDFP